jgi:hypothetical protein
LIKVHAASINSWDWDMLSETAEAFQYFGEGHFKGKIVIAVENNNKT